MLMNNDVIGISSCLKQRPSFPLYSCLLHLPMIAIKSTSKIFIVSIERGYEKMPNIIRQTIPQKATEHSVEAFLFFHIIHKGNNNRINIMHPISAMT